MDPAILAHTPALQPPPGVVPNFVNPLSQADQTRAVICTALPIMVVLLILRVYTRLRVTRAFGADDYLCIVAAMSVIAFCGVVLSILGNPLGPHQWNVPLIHITERFLKISLTVICLYAVSAILVKSTLLVLYLRIFRPSQRARIMIWGGIIVIVVFYVCCIVVNTVLCVPHSGDGGWLSEKSQARCSKPELNLSVTQGVFSAISDFYVLCIPLQLVWGLRLPTARKIGVSSIFLTGLLACICSITGAVYRFKQDGSDDFTWQSIPVYSLGVAELNVGIICSSMPVIFVLFKGFSNKFFRIPSLRYFRSRGKRTAEGDRQDQLPVSVPENKLPEVPKPTMTGLRSFIRKAYRSQAPQTTQISSYSELNSIGSIEDDYHAQLKAAH